MCAGFNDVGFIQLLNGFPEPGVHTPTINHLAASGVTFANMYVTCVCSPTRASILTGRYSVNTGITGLIGQTARYGLPLNETTLPTLLTEHGYKTHLVRAEDGMALMRMSMLLHQQR